MRKETCLDIACTALGIAAILAFAYVTSRTAVALHAWRRLGWADDGFHVGMASGDMWAMLTTCLALCGTAAMLFVWQRGHSRFIVRVAAVTGGLSLLTALALRMLLSLGANDGTTYRSAGEASVTAIAADVHRPGGDSQSSRNAVVTGTRAARNAGNNPPMNPMASAHLIPVHKSSGLTWKRKTTWLKLAPRVEAV